MTAPSEGKEGKMTTKEVLEAIRENRFCVSASSAAEFFKALAHLTAMAEDYEKVKAALEDGEKAKEDTIAKRRVTAYWQKEATAKLLEAGQTVSELHTKLEKAEAELARYKRYDKLIEERKRQDEKWGVQNHGPDGWLMILMEEVGEVAKAILEGDPGDYRKELVQAAAVAVAALECLDRNEGWPVDISLVKAQKEIAHLRAILACREEGK